MKKHIVNTLKAIFCAAPMIVVLYYYIPAVASHDTKAAAAYSHR